VFLEGLAAGGVRVVFEFPTKEHAVEFTGQIMPDGSTVIEVNADADPPFIKYVPPREADSEEQPPEIRIPLHPAVAYYLRTTGTGSSAMQAALVERGQLELAAQLRGFIGAAASDEQPTIADRPRVTREPDAAADAEASAEQLERLRVECDRVGMSSDAVAERVGIASVEELTSSEAERIIAGLASMADADTRAKRRAAAARGSSFWPFSADETAELLNDDDQTPQGEALEDQSQDPDDYDEATGLRRAGEFLPDTMQPSSAPENPNADDWLASAADYNDNDDNDNDEDQQ
jgi:hypothetical protein